ncbi:dgkA [Lepeophtheirus salmonis]|uniref:diacylglycerol kinase (ATP) n=1 Tax=Lepeophtheirus salmonis TaxID=72036 RepID=A0A7R8CWT3_LEPSM|nr:dgkA [Lepeophtheirus salmonis]CAF2925195.1 dgkA [Lepeophtheirus salmonis]
MTTISHSWQIVSHARPTFCNVCREALVGVTSHGLSCGVCKLKAHKTCAADVIISCKWTTIETVDTSCLSLENDSANIHHQWLEGNLPVSAKCVVCDKTCGSVLRLQDWRCLWCRATAPTRHATVPPTCLSHNPETDEWKVMHPFPGSPLIIFVNSKSGNGHGDRFLIRFKQYLNPSQVYDLSSTGPKKGLQIFRHLAPLRLLVCGGDGSISWVLKEIDVLQLKAERVCVSVLPLGTGNDLARVCGWGAAIEADVNIINLLEKYDVGTPRLLDRWSIMSVETNAADCLPEDDEDEINDRKGSIFGTTGTEVIRDICDEQLISHEDLELENCMESLDRLQICKTLGELRGQLNTLKSERTVDSNVLVEESNKETHFMYATVFGEIAKTMAVIVRATNENSNLYQFASEIQNSVIEYMLPEEKVKTDSVEEPIFELKRSKSKELKEVENLSKQCLEQDIQIAQNKFDVGSLNQKLEDFELILSTALNPFDDVFDTSKHALFQGESNELLSLSNDNIKNEETFEEEVFMKSITASESSSSSSSDSNSNHSEDEDQPEKDTEDEVNDEKKKNKFNQQIIPVIRLEKDKNDEGEGHLLSNLSPLPSPVERSLSLTGHASSLPVPEAFSDIFNKKDEDSDVNKSAFNEIDTSDVGKICLPCPEIRISSPLLSTESNAEEKGDPSKDDSEETSSTLTASSNAEAPRSRRSSRFPSNAGLLTSVPEDGQMPNFIVNETCGSPDLLTINNNDIFATQRACGSRRLSVGAMVSLSALRAGETAGNSTSGIEKSNSSISSFNTSTPSSVSGISSSIGARTTNKNYTHH